MEDIDSNCIKTSIKVYNRRSIVETVFSVIKRKFGEIVKARKYYNQVKEINVKMLVYNINKNIISSGWMKLRISTKPLSSLFIKSSALGFMVYPLNFNLMFRGVI
ncbi:MAG TPA: transposase [Methanosarcina sp.]